MFENTKSTADWLLVGRRDNRDYYYFFTSYTQTYLQCRWWIWLTQEVTWNCVCFEAESFPLDEIQRSENTTQRLALVLHCLLSLFTSEEPNTQCFVMLMRLIYICCTCFSSVLLSAAPPPPQQGWQSRASITLQDLQWGTSGFLSSLLRFLSGDLVTWRLTCELLSLYCIKYALSNNIYLL